MYTVFSRVTDGAFDQINHSEIKSKWIANHSRSQKLKMTEKRPFNVYGMISYERRVKIQKLVQDELKKFVEPGASVGAEVLCPRYLKEDIELTLIPTEKPNILDVEVKMPCKNRVRLRVLPCLCNFC
jgi:hypothetical protein